MRPTILSLALALAVPSCRGGTRPAATISPADSADQVLIGMSHYVTSDGVQRAKVLADTAYFYSNTQSALLETVHITFYGAAGEQTSVLTAKTGTYFWRTGDMEARGNVVVVTTDGRTLRTEALRYEEGKNQVISDLPFIFDGPQRHVEGEGFTSDPTFKNIVAKHPRGTGGQFTLPDQ
jgi:LPS export ABC transporter protein LptC